MPRKNRIDVEKESFSEPGFRQALKKQVDAILFSAGRKVALQELSKLCGFKYEDGLREIVKELKSDYDASDSPMMIVEDADAWKLTVRERYVQVIKRIVPEMEISKGVLETLAVIAFKHPILQSELVEIRSNKAYDHLTELEESGFVVREPYKRSKMIKLTKKFYDYFDVPPDKVKDAFAGFEAVKGAISAQEGEAAVLPPDDRLGELKVYEAGVPGEKAGVTAGEALPADGTEAMAEIGAVVRDAVSGVDESIAGIGRDTGELGVAEAEDVAGEAGAVSGESEEPKELSLEEKEKIAARMQAREQMENQAAVRADEILAGSTETELPEGIQKKIEEKVERMFLKPKKDGDTCASKDEDEA